MRLATLIAISTTLVTAGLILAAPAGAYKLGGARWPGSPARITYYDATPASYRFSVEQAVLAWNTSGVRVRFVKVRSRRRAQVLIHRGEVIGPGSGMATLGYTPHADVELNKGSTDKWFYAGVVAHELGHVIGLDHARRGCATMTPSVWMNCRPVFPPHDWQWRCRLLMRDDLNGARARYGGRIRLRTAMWCEKEPPAAAPPALSATQLTVSPLDVARVTVTIPRRAASVEILRKAGSCPSSQLDGDAQSVGTVKGAVGTSRSIIDKQTPFGALAPGSYCYGAFAVDQWSRTGGSRTAMLDYTGPPPVPTSDVTAVAANPRLHPTDGSDPVYMDVTISAPTASWLTEIDVYRKLGSCPTGIDDPGNEIVGIAPAGASTQHVADTILPAEGHWCIAAFTGDVKGRYAAAGATQEIDYTPPQSAPPTNFTLTRIDATTVHVTWTWPADAVFAFVARSTDGCASIDTVAEVTGVLGIAYVDPAYEPPELYDYDSSGSVCYAIATVDALGYYSPVVTATIT